MKENPVSMEMGGGFGVGLDVAEVVVGAIVDFAKEVIPDELKPKPKPVQESNVSFGDLLRIAAVRSELRALTNAPQAERLVVPIVPQPVV